MKDVQRRAVGLEINLREVLVAFVGDDLIGDGYGLVFGNDGEGDLDWSEFVDGEVPEVGEMYADINSGLYGILVVVVFKFLHVD